MKIKLKALKRIIQEAQFPMGKWQAWLGAFDRAYEKAGFEVKSDLPPYEWISSESAAAEQIDDGIQAMFEAGLTPDLALAEMMNCSDFWEKWVGEDPIEDSEED